MCTSVCVLIYVSVGVCVCVLVYVSVGVCVCSYLCECRSIRVFVPLKHEALQQH